MCSLHMQDCYEPVKGGAACGGWYKPVLAGTSLWWPVRACGRLCKPVAGYASLWWPV